MSLLALLVLLLLAIMSLATAMLWRNSADIEIASWRIFVLVAPPFAGMTLCVGALLDGGDAAALPIPLGAPFGFDTVATLDAVGLLAGPALLGATTLLTLLAPVPRARVALLAAGALLTVIGGDGLLLGTGLAMLALAAYGTEVETVAIVLLFAAALAPLLASTGGGIGDALALARAAGAAHRSGLIASALGIGAGSVLLLRAPRALPAARAATTAAGFLLVVRFAFDLDGAPASSAVGASLLLGGAGLAAAAARDALRAATLDAVVEALGASNGALIAAMLGAGMLARAADLSDAEAAALGAASLLGLSLAVALPLARTVAAALAIEAGSAALAATGGLGRAAPRMSALLACALASLAPIPGGAAFAPMFILVDLLLGPQRFGGTELALALGLALGVLALATALLFAALFRVGAIALLGLPRTPRAAAAAEPVSSRRRAFTASAAILVALTLVPGAALVPFAPALRALAGADLAGRADPWRLAASDAGAIWCPLAVAAMLVAAFAAARRLRPHRRIRHVAAWDGGAPPPPDWLPFGEPLAQLAPGSLAAILLGPALGGSVEHDPARPDPS